MMCEESYTPAVSEIHLMNKFLSGHLRTNHYPATLTY